MSSLFNKWLSRTLTEALGTECEVTSEVEIVREGTRKIWVDEDGDECECPCCGYVPRGAREIEVPDLSRLLHYDVTKDGETTRTTFTDFMMVVSEMPTRIRDELLERHRAPD